MPGSLGDPSQARACFDEEVARAVADALASNASVPSGQVKAQVSQGWVMLEGTVDWHYQAAGVTIVASQGMPHCDPWGVG
jgi:osmotically-inducible protein OsmY